MLRRPEFTVTPRDYAGSRERDLHDHDSRNRTKPVPVIPIVCSPSAPADAFAVDHKGRVIS